VQDYIFLLGVSTVSFSSSTDNVFVAGSDYSDNFPSGSSCGWLPVTAASVRDVDQPNLANDAFDRVNAAYRFETTSTTLDVTAGKCLAPACCRVAATTKLAITFCLLYILLMK
jgi:hypothetical protein